MEGFDTFEQKGRLSGGLTDDARVLDDLLQELWIHVPTLANALQEFHKLKELKGDELRDESYKLNLVLKEVQSAMMELWNSDRVTELLRELEPTDGQPSSTSSRVRRPKSNKQTHHLNRPPCLRRLYLIVASSVLRGIFVSPSSQ